MCFSFIHREYIYTKSNLTFLIDYNSTCRVNICYNTEEGELFDDPDKYRRLVGKLNYLIVTCSNIAYSVSVLSQYKSSPIVNHWAVVEHILCYLKEALGRGVLYKKHGHTRVECFLDAD